MSEVVAEDVNAAAPAADDDVAAPAAEHHPEEESTAEFQPVVQLAAVETRTGEEEEEVIYSQRSKVYVYGETLLNKGTGIKTWNERGVGDAKLLLNSTTGTIRLLMRQDKTMKIVINHQMDPRIEIQPQAGSDRAYCWSAFDFSDGVALVETVFALKFKDDELANAFLKEFLQAQEKMRSLGYGGGAAADEKDETPSGEASSAADAITDALAGLSTSENAAEEAKES